MDFLNIIYFILRILGALGLFLFGMKLMSESLQKVVGKKIRNIITVMTSNKYKAVISGLTLTAVIQASSATTVMLVSFVNAGILSLTESIGVMMGANIGTTIKIWLITLIGVKFNLSFILLPMIGLSLPFLFSKNASKRSMGEFFMGFALLFLGIDFIIQILPDLQSNTEIISFLKAHNSSGYGSILLYVFYGLLLTAIVQSSSATITITVILSANGYISYELAAAMILGENIGTTITANIAAIIANQSAKKTAFSHTFFNISGVIWALILFYPFLNLIDWIVASLWNSSPFENIRLIPIALCFFHTLFNLINTLVWINFIPVMTKILNFLFVEKNKKEKYNLKNINTGLLSTSELSINIVQKEIHEFALKARKMINFIPVLLLEKKEENYQQLLEKINKNKEKSEKLSKNIKGFLNSLSENEISPKASGQIIAMNKITDNLDYIVNIAYQLSKIIDDKNKRKLWFTQSLRDQLMLMFELVEEAMSNMLINLISEYQSFSIDYSREIEDKINNLRNSLIEKNNQDVIEKEYTFQAGAVYINMIASYEKAGDMIFEINKMIAYSDKKK